MAESRLLGCRDAPQHGAHGIGLMILAAPHSTEPTRPPISATSSHTLFVAHGDRMKFTEENCSWFMIRRTE